MFETNIMETNRNKGVLACCHFRVVRKSPAEVTFEPRPSGSSEKSHRKIWTRAFQERSTASAFQELEACSQFLRNRRRLECLEGNERQDRSMGEVIGLEYRKIAEGLVGHCKD